MTEKNRLTEKAMYSTVRLRRPPRKSERQLDKTHQKLMCLVLNPTEKCVKEKEGKINRDERLNGFRAVPKFPLIIVTQNHFRVFKLI